MLYDNTFPFTLIETKLNSGVLFVRHTSTIMWLLVINTWSQFCWSHILSCQEQACPIEIWQKGKEGLRSNWKKVNDWGKMFESS